MVGQAGKPKTITGFQTHTTPVLLAYGERAELATEECILSHAILLLFFEVIGKRSSISILRKTKVAVRSPSGDQKSFF